MKKIPAYCLHVMVGPTQSGKSTFLKNHFSNHCIISSDEERRFLLGKNSHRYDGDMFSVSSQAFSILYAKAEAAMQAMVPHIFIDTTGSCLEDLAPIAKKNGYNIHVVAMNLSRKEYLRYVSEADKLIVNKSIKKHAERLSKLRSKDYQFRTNLKSAHLLKPTFLCEAPPYQFSSDKFAVIGDIHGQVERARDLLSQVEPEVDNIFWVGDVLDPKGKDKNLEETISFVEERMDKGDVFLIGNHEAYAHERINGRKALDIEEEYFGDTPQLLANPELSNRFLSIFEKMIPFCTVHPFLNTQTRPTEISHVPVKRVYRCKPRFSNKNIRRYHNREDTHLNQLADYLEEMKNGCLPYHISGHITHNGDKIKHGPAFLIDTGGGFDEGVLTAVVLKDNYWTIKQSGVKGKFQSLKQEKVFEVDEATEKKINNLLKCGCPFISGTMSPPPPFEGQLETARGAINLFRSKEINELIVQPKHMGSRATMRISIEDSQPEPKDNSYTFKKKDVVYQVSWYSRKGYGIPQHKVDLESLSEEWLDKTLENKSSFKEIILDGELMPWSSLGEGLVEKYQSFINLGKKVRQYGLPCDGLEEMQKQLDIFGVKGDPVFCPFSILRYTDSNTTCTPEYDWDYHKIQDSLYGIDIPFYSLITLEDYEGFVEDLDNILNGTITKSDNPLFNYLLNSYEGGLMEGVVIKPFKAEDRLKIPYIKVRNKEYLRLVYGPDYLSNLSTHVASKDIRGKLNISRQEYALGRDMLKGDVRNSMIKLLGHIQKEGNLDPRL